MIHNENIKLEDLDQEQNFWFWKFAILHTILAEDEFNWHPLSLTNYTPIRIHQRSTNQTTRAQREAEVEE